MVALPGSVLRAGRVTSGAGDGRGFSAVAAGGARGWEA